MLRTHSFLNRFTLLYWPFSLGNSLFLSLAVFSLCLVEVYSRWNNFFSTSKRCPLVDRHMEALILGRWWTSRPQEHAQILHRRLGDGQLEFFLWFLFWNEQIQPFTASLSLPPSLSNIGQWTEFLDSSQRRPASALSGLLLCFFCARPCHAMALSESQDATFFFWEWF